MSAQLDQFDRDLAAVETDLPVIFSFNGRDYIGQQTATIEAWEMGDSGYEAKFDFELLVRAAIYAPERAPVIRETIGIIVNEGRKTYRIERITPSQDGISITYGLVESL